MDDQGKKKIHINCKIVFCVTLWEIFTLFIEP